MLPCTDSRTSERKTVVKQAEVITARLVQDERGWLRLAGWIQPLQVRTEQRRDPRVPRACRALEADESSRMPRTNHSV